MTSLDNATLAFIRNHRLNNVDDLALQRGKYPDVDFPLAVRQIAGWQKLRLKVPSWAEKEALLYPLHLPLEQCSSEATARYKARLMERILGGCCRRMADLTGGFGIDFSFLSPLAQEAVYVERQAELCALATHNFEVLGLQRFSCIEGNGLEALQTILPLDFLFLDPARRDSAGRKTVNLEDCEPNVLPYVDRLFSKARYILLKLSPMLSISRAATQLPHLREIHCVATQNECKELLFLLDSAYEGEVTYYCSNDDHCFSFTASEEAQADCSYTSQPLRYLYEPNVALLKAGAYKLPALRFGLNKLHPNSHLYTSDTLCPDFPGRTFRLEGVSSFNRKTLRTFLCGIKQANLTVRNFPETVATLRSRLKLAEGGDVYLFATTLADGSHVILLTEREKG